MKKKRARIIVWTIAAAAVVGALYLFGKVHDDALIAKCETRSLESLQLEAKQWIVTRLTKSRNQNSDTAVPDGTQISEIEFWGFSSDELRDMAFYTEASGGIAFDFHFNQYCGHEVAAQRCPNRQCQIGRLVTRSPSL